MTDDQTPDPATPPPPPSTPATPPSESPPTAASPTGTPPPPQAASPHTPPGTASPPPADRVAGSTAAPNAAAGGGVVGSAAALAAAANRFTAHAAPELAADGGGVTEPGTDGGAGLSLAAGDRPPARGRAGRGGAVARQARAGPVRGRGRGVHRPDDRRRHRVVAQPAAGPPGPARNPRAARRLHREGAAGRPIRDISASTPTGSSPPIVAFGSAWRPTNPARTPFYGADSWQGAQGTEMRIRTRAAGA